VTGYDEAGLAQVPQALIEQAVLEVIELLENDALRERAVKKNIALGREYYSLDTLRKILGEELS
jgi:hypothetical protein